MSIIGLNIFAAAAETVEAVGEKVIEVVEPVAETAMNTVTDVVTTLPAIASTEQGNVDLSSVTEPIIKLINSILTAAIPLVASVGALYCVLLGVKYARAEEPQDREKAKQHLKGAIVGFVLIFVLIVALRIATPILTEWMKANS